MSQLDLFTDLLSILIMGTTSVVFFILIFRFKDQQKDSFIEKIFLYGIFAALCASLSVVIFHLPYLLSEQLTFPFWTVGSYFYYLFMALALTFILATGFGIKYGEPAIKNGYIVMISPFTTTITYLGGFVSQPDINQANMEMELLGVLLVFGTLLIFLIITTSFYWLIYFETRLRSVFYMALGMLIISIGAIGGGLGDYIGGDIAIIILDPASFLSILVGVVLIHNGFLSKKTAT